MGGGTRRFRRGNRSFAQKRRDKKQNGNSEPVRRSYQDIERTNPNFIEYYKKQNIVPEEEWSEFMSALGRDLPAAFRISSCSVSEANSLLQVIEGKFFKQLIEEGTSDGETPRKPLCLPWYPRRLCWQLQLTRKDIRRSESYFRLHNFLISETASGNISRQEVVSMIPPLLLDVQPHHKVLDMCAAPGSKTSQLIELMHSDESKVPDGVVIGNDIDNSRCYMLVHQAKRLNSPCVVITNHDSSVMPNFVVTTPGGEEEILKFDRVLCDVPCTGDGTLRKNADIWLKWNTANGNNLHGIQIRILRRGVEMLAVGGKVVYSTCSFNPIEDEAVIHRVLVEAEGSLQLIDVNSQLPGIKSCPGVSHWYPGSRDMSLYNSYEDVSVKWQSQVSPPLFPPSKEDAPKFNLHRCIRILPHHQDTGGFFVAVLEKVKLLPWEAGGKTKDGSKNVASGDTITEEQNETDSRSSGMGSSGVGDNRRVKRRKIQGYREDPFVFFEENEPVWPSIRDFYQLDPSIHAGLLTRCAVGKKKNIYFVSPTVRQVAEHNQNRVKLINTGVRAFVRCDNVKKCEDHCSFRLAQEGLSSISSFIGKKRRVQVSKNDLLVLLSNNDPKYPPEIALLSNETQEQIKDMSNGSCLLEYRGECGLNFDLVGWRGVHSMRAYISLSDCVHYLRLLGGDVSKYERNKFKKDEEIKSDIQEGDGDIEADEIKEVEEVDRSLDDEKEEVLEAS
ncbi:tRNA (cytosine(34)-C(5))-methyltransferase Nsun2 [Lycorma delicatula]|uniref:tRNA (cytosine(34)-C(5))-methyltransferase Nsun2 n=1 Tax=Lycorma delicatula TaxID=130591 RepID=UPI003F5122B3